MKRDKVDDVIKEKVTIYESDAGEHQRGTEELWGRLDAMIDVPKKTKVLPVYYRIAAMLLIVISIIALASTQYKKGETTLAANKVLPAIINQEARDTIVKQPLTAQSPAPVQKIETYLQAKARREIDMAIESTDEADVGDGLEEDDPSTYGLYATCETTGTFYNEHSTAY